MTTFASVHEALSIIGGFSAPSKMPGYSWSISARECQVGSKLREIPGSTCSTCYALKGNYVFDNVTASHARRKAALDHPRFEEAFVFALTETYRRMRSTYMRSGKLVREDRFRWFDAGDLQSLEMLEMINRIALATPQLRHWLPTRELGYVKQFLDKHGEFAKNLLVRPSTPMIGDRFNDKPFGLPFSTVDRPARDIRRCPASSQGNKCLDCDTCWTKANVSYASH